jgi:dephospho-CoA kinase
MKIIGITGSIASGKTTVARLMAGKKYPLFSADMVVSSLYKKKTFNKILIKKFKLNRKEKIKDQIKLILKKKGNIYKLESVIHPFVRKEMVKFLKKKMGFYF